MALYYELPVYRLSYKMVYMLFENTSNFAREYKYTIGQELKEEGLHLIKNIYRANRMVDKSTSIRDARENIEMIRLFLRLVQDFNQIKLKNFVEINLLIENISKQLTSWEKYSKIKLSDSLS